MKRFHLPAILSLAIFAFACTPTEQPADVEQVPEGPALIEMAGHAPLPEWAVDANIYEVNIRQYTPEGTFNAFGQHLPRLAEMGVDILWFMPIFPISDTKRKGSLGSYYAISDFKSVNPKFGTMADFQALVDQAHDLGMYVILDWTPNHTGWDHPWITEHPDWYTQRGDTITHALNNDGTPTDWYDVADLNHDNPDMQDALIADLAWWLTDVGVDGFRCDVAHSVPLSFWQKAVPAFRAADPDIFMLAESEQPPLRNEALFNSDYGWAMHHVLNDVAQGKKDVNAIDQQMAKQNSENTGGFPMHFTTNHDENSWNGTVFERMGDAHKPMAVLTATLEGIPLIYSGQEEPLDHRLAFFEKDLIPFEDYAYEEFYKALFALKKAEEALWNGPHGAQPQRINDSDSVYAFQRTKGESDVVVVLNLSAESATTTLNRALDGHTELFSGEQVTLAAGEPIDLEPWGYKVFR